jgi:hypothetical protein
MEIFKLVILLDGIQPTPSYIGVDDTHRGYNGYNNVFLGTFDIRGTLIQTAIPTIAGGLYTLSYYLLNYGEGPTQYFSAHIDGNPPFLGSIIDLTSGFLPFMDWTLYSFTFTAASNSTTLTFTGRQDLSAFNLTDISILAVGACFGKGTKILTATGYQRIECLRKGDLIKTYNHGHIPVNIIGVSNTFNSVSQRYTHQLYQLSESKYPELSEPLIITGRHSILVNKEYADKINSCSDNYMIDDLYKLPVHADNRAVYYEPEGMFPIYHLALDNVDTMQGYGIYANGLLVESCSIDYMINDSGMKFIE